MPGLDSKIKFFFETPIPLKERAKLKRFIASIFRWEKCRLDKLIYVFTNDKTLLALNKKYLDHNYYTDVLSFDLSEEALVLGEIYISIDRVRENALKLKSSLTDELHRVIFHGALHLCGYNDQSLKQKNAMRRLEDFYLEKYKVVSRKTVS